MTEILYPDGAVCIACGALHVCDAARRLCTRCASEMPPPIEIVTDPLEDSGLFACSSAYPHQGIPRQLVRALKYDQVCAAAEALAMGMSEVLNPAGYDALVPVPLHKRRQRQRGFNQARVLAEALSSMIGLPVLDALIRTRATKTQTAFAREGRLQNVQGAFEAVLAVPGASLLLIDDVLTTGATATACAQVLLESGVGRVSLWTATHALVHLSD